MINQNTSVQAQVQGDFALNGDPVLENFLGAPTGLNEIGEFEDPSLIHLSVALSRSLYRRPGSWFRQALFNAELHYTSTLNSADVVSNSDINYGSSSANFNVFNTTLGMHSVLGDHLVLTPAVALPLSSSSDQNYDYQAMVQLNYLR